MPILKEEKVCVYFYTPLQFNTLLLLLDVWRIYRIYFYIIYLF